MSGRPLTAAMVESDIVAMRRLLDLLENGDVTTRAQFSDLMSAAFRPGGLELRALADALSFTFSSVFRWREGRSAPHPALVPRIVAWVVTALHDRIVEQELLLASLQAKAA